MKQQEKENMIKQLESEIKSDEWGMEYHEKHFQRSKLMRKTHQKMLEKLTDEQAQSKKPGS